MSVVYTDAGLATMLGERALPRMLSSGLIQIPFRLRETFRLTHL